MNMSYCRFENTYSDLADCVDALEDNNINSESEHNYARRMYDLCQKYIDTYEDFAQFYEK